MTKAEVSIGERLRDIRTSQGLSMNRLAKLANLSHGYINDILKEKYKPKKDNLRKIAHGLGCCISDLEE